MKDNLVITFFYSGRLIDLRNLACYTNGSRIEICNGPSFFVHLLGGKDKCDFIFIRDNPMTISDLDKLLKSDSLYDKVYCSIIYEHQLRGILPFIKKNWVIGGSMAEFMDPNDYECEIWRGPFEFNLGTGLSSEFNMYFMDLIKYSNFSPKLVRFTCSMAGGGCYWNKCKFCYSHDYIKHFPSRDIPYIMDIIYSELKPYVDKYSFAIHTCKQALTKKDIIDIVSNVREDVRGIRFDGYIRADDFVLDAVESLPSKKLDRFNFTIGIEAFSQRIIDIINKGFSLETGFKIIEVLLRKGAFVLISIMSDYFFMDKDMFQECISNINRLLDLVKRTRSLRFVIADHRYISWPDDSLIREFGFDPVNVSNTNLVKRYTVDYSGKEENLVYNIVIKEFLKRTFGRMYLDANLVSSAASFSVGFDRRYKKLIEGFWR